MSTKRGILVVNTEHQLFDNLEQLPNVKGDRT